jgi:hypothetical protein
MIFGAPTRIVLCLLIGVLVGLIGVVLGAPFIMVLLVALGRSGTHGDPRKGTRIARAPLPCRRRARSDEFRPPRTYTCPIWVISRHNGPFDSCPICPQKRTFVSAG